MDNIKDNFARANVGGYAGKDRPAGELARAHSIFSRLERYMLNVRPYRDPGFGYKQLLPIVGTNTSYLYHAVKAVTGMTLQEYINSYRMRDARMMLEQYPCMTVYAIAHDCGFRNTRTFYRQHREKYGCSPRCRRND